MSRPPPIDLYTFGIILDDDRERIVRGLLKLIVELSEVKILLNHCKLKQPMQNTVRYIIGRYLNVRRESFEYLDQHFEWSKENLDLEEHQDRRFRRHASSIDQRVAEGMELYDVLQLPALTLRDAKSRQDRDLEQSLDALRSLRGDLQDKIVKK